MLFLIGTSRRVTIMKLFIQGIWQIFKVWLPNVIYAGYSLLSQPKFRRCILSVMRIKGTSVSPTLSIDLMLIGTLLSTSITAYLCLPPPVCTVHIGIEAFWWRIAVRAMLWGINEMLCLGWLPHEPSRSFDDVWAPVLDSALVIHISSHILESVKFPLLENLLIWHASHELLDAISIIEAWEMKSNVFLLQQVDMVHLHALLLDPTPDLCVQFKCCKCVVGIVL